MIVQLIGPTASGKSELAITLAQKFRGEIISADSVQVYKGFDIGSAKVPAKIRAEIPHHLIDIIDNCIQYNAAQFLQKSYHAAVDILQRNKLPIVCGGTALYLKTMIKGIFPEKAKDERLRTSLKMRIASQGSLKLWEELKSIDPIYAAKISPQDKVRIVRALEIYYLHGSPPSELFKKTASPFEGFNFLRIGLLIERNRLYARINQRVEQMINSGLIDEVKALLQSKPENCPPFKAIGYREVLRFLKGELNYLQMVDEIKKNSRHFAKRQLSWFRQEKDIIWFPDHDQDEIIKFIEQNWNAQ